MSDTYYKNMGDYLMKNYAVAGFHMSNPHWRGFIMGNMDAYNKDRFKQQAEFNALSGRVRTTNYGAAIYNDNSSMGETATDRANAAKILEDEENKLGVRLGKMGANVRGMK